MTDLTFKVNDTDFSGIVEKGSYITDRTMVVGAKYTDLNKVDHTTIVRDRGYLEVTLNPTSQTQIASLYTAIRNAPCKVKYHSFQKGTDVEEMMIPSLEPLQDAKKRSSGHWVRKVRLTFTEE